MLKQLQDLETVTMKLEQATSLFNCMCQNYFENREPSGYALTAGYQDYTNVMEVIRDLIYTQTDLLNEATKTLYKICWELSDLAKQNMSLLENGTKGGAISG